MKYAKTEKREWTRDVYKIKLKEQIQKQDINNKGSNENQKEIS
jgi:hypothetical protein